MAPLSLLLSFLGKKIGSIIQAIFGWSVTALFGRLPQKKQIAISIALLFSIAWPIFVLGVFVPDVAGWVLAFLPLEDWLGPVAMRILWGALAVVAPLIVGALTHWAAPRKRVGIGRALLYGYPLALGFFVAFLLTVVTVPIVKVASIVHGWADQHVYVQPREGCYDDVLRELAEACARAGLVPEVTDVPPAMGLSTKVLTFLAKGVVTPIVAEQVKRVRAEGIELYLYPSDLLLRGEPEKVSLVRAMLTRTDVDEDAYLVGSAAGQCIQDELGRLITIVREHEQAHREVGSMAASRLVRIWNEMNQSKLPFDEWVMLESITRRLERRLAGGALPIDREDDELDAIAGTANAKSEPLARQETVMAIERTPATPHQVVSLEETSTVQLVKEAMDEAKELVRLEVQLAKEEVKEELQQVKHAAIAFAIALGASLILLCLLAMALVLALGGTPGVALGVAAVFLVIGGLAAWVGYGMLPKDPLVKTRHRLEKDMNQLKEHLA